MLQCRHLERVGSGDAACPAQEVGVDKFHDLSIAQGVVAETVRVLHTAELPTQCGTASICELDLKYGQFQLRSTLKERTG